MKQEVRWVLPQNIIHSLGHHILLSVKITLNLIIKVLVHFYITTLTLPYSLSLQGGGVQPPQPLKPITGNYTTVHITILLFLMTTSGSSHLYFNFYPYAMLQCSYKFALLCTILVILSRKLVPYLYQVTVYSTNIQ